MRGRSLPGLVVAVVLVGACDLPSDDGSPVDDIAFDDGEPVVPTDDGVEDDGVDDDGIENDGNGGGEDSSRVPAAAPWDLPEEEDADPDLSLLAQACEGGDLGACDDLYLNSPVGSAYEEYASTCGGRGTAGGRCVARFLVLSTDLSPRSGGAEGTPGTLEDVRIGAHEGFDRFVLEFAGGLAGHRVGYLDARPDPAPDGRAFLEVVVDTGLGDGVAERLRGRGTTNVQEAMASEVGQDRVVWVVGVAEQTGFDVFTLSDPARIVVDVGHR